MGLDMVLPFFLSHFLLIFITTSIAEEDQISQSAECILKHRLNTVKLGVYLL